MSVGGEPQAVAERYARRAAGDLYSPLRPDVCRLLQERQRAMLGLFAAAGIVATHSLRATEVGSGTGGNLLELMQLGFEPSNLQGIELLPERHAQARARLPEAVRLLQGDATTAAVEPASQDLVLQATVFSSLLDDAFQQRLADTMWRWLRPGGAVLWYDFAVNNPRNPDVRGVPLARVRALFPQAAMVVRRVTLAPPIARAVTRLHPALYEVFNAVPWLRTHRLVWLGKPG